MQSIPTRILSRTIGLVALLALMCVPAFGEDDAGQKVYKHGLKSTAFIIRPVAPKRIAMGSGSLIDGKKKLVLTNEHVVGNAEKVAVFFPIFEKGKPVNDKERYLSKEGADFAQVGKVLFKDVLRDLAVIQLEKLPPGIIPVKFAADNPDVGAAVHSIGNPGASDALWIYTPGKVRSVYKKNWVAGQERTEHKATIIETTSPTNPGDSGGPLFNDKCEQVGVTQGGIVDAKTQGYSYFISQAEVKALLKEHKIVVNSAPPEPEPAENTTAKTDPGPKSPGTATADQQEKDEKSANLILSLTKSFVNNPDKRDIAITRLNELIAKYPKTKAAGEATELLKKLRM